MPQNLSAQFVCPSPKVWDFNEKRLHWASVVRDGSKTDHFLDPPTQFFCQRNKWMVPNTLIWTFPIRYALIASFFTPSKLANTKVSSIVVTFNTKTMDTRRSMKGRNKNIFIELLLTTCFHEKQKPKSQFFSESD